MKKGRHEETLEAGEYWVSYRDPDMHECPPVRCFHDRVFNVLCWLVFALMLPGVVFMVWAFVMIYRGA